MTLYRIEPGESCVLTMSCLLGKNTFPAIAVVENDCEVFLIPSDKLRNWILKYPKWNEYIFNYLSNVLVNVIGLLEDITFKRMDSRILEYLVDLSFRTGK